MDGDHGAGILWRSEVFYTQCSTVQTRYNITVNVKWAYYSELQHTMSRQASQHQTRFIICQPNFSGTSSASAALSCCLPVLLLLCGSFFSYAQGAIQTTGKTLRFQPPNTTYLSPFLWKMPFWYWIWIEANDKTYPKDGTCVFTWDMLVLQLHSCRCIVCFGCIG